MEAMVFCFLSFFLSFLKLYLFIYKYTVAVFRHIRRGHQIPLQMAVSHHVVAGV
ncbi:rCG42211 [Rattus norvegicus]|uniref:RCG42211 n=1 Tax=Rattus norvegicus TaxID=10116 RepID=A6K065_RAT|nr:rCG42211 [Rattus norvegicus]